MAEANLLQNAWLPVRRASGPARVNLHDLTTDLLRDPILDLDWPRADFRIACLEMLIGLLATACPPEDEEEWTEWWHNPPAPDILAAKFAPFAHAFVLDGDGPRFCQDLDDLQVDPVPIQWLLIDAPGENTEKLNKDLLVKRDRQLILCRPAAAIALYTLQAFASGGGPGYRTSLRGGGPLTTLVRPTRHDADYRTLWHLLWANVPYGHPPEPKDLPKVFPWLAPTRRSEGDVGTVLDSDQAHKLQAFWGMPRRMRLDYRASETGELCGLTGLPDAVVVNTFRRHNYGVKYVNAACFHPLTPTYRNEKKPGDPPLAKHLQPDGIGYIDWHKLVSSSEGEYDAATTVSTFTSRKPLRDTGLRWPEARLLVAGYDMVNDKARSFAEQEMPLFLIEEDGLRRNFLSLSGQLAEGATQAAAMLREAIQEALRVPAAKNKNRATVDDARARFFELTTSDFWEILRDTLNAEPFRSEDEFARDAARMAAAAQWRDVLRTRALDIFDETAPLDPLAPNAAGILQAGQWKPPPIVAAKRNLAIGLRGYGKNGEGLFASLGLQLPEKKPAKPKPEKTRKAARNG